MNEILKNKLEDDSSDEVSEQLKEMAKNVEEGADFNETDASIINNILNPFGVSINLEYANKKITDKKLVRRLIDDYSKLKENASEGRSDKVKKIENQMIEIYDNM